VPAAVAPSAEDVVQGQPGVVERLGQVGRAVDREEQGFESHEVRGEREEARSLGQRLADQPEAELLQVTQPTVDQPGRARGGARRDVVLLDQCGTHAARHGIEQYAGADNAAADHDDVPRLGGEGSDVRPATFEWSGRSCAWAGLHAHRSGAPGPRREIRHNSQPVPTIRTPIATGVS